ncbi:MAG: LysM peptidoglycan-binding domain-containing protein [Verrucomicrobiales bacterium]|nr:LysM peptidoglycan-binding domain-containing protein [Verrucomicrobiales bacterium]
MKLLPLHLSLALLLGVSHLGAAESSSHKVKAKETLTAIARQHGVTVAALKAANELKSDLIRVGQVLKIPGAVAITPTKTDTPKHEAPAADPISTALAALSQEDRWRVHIFLDRALFAPGKLDGLMGEFTMKAATRWISSAPGRSIDSLVQAARAEVSATTFVHKIPEVAARFVGTLPTKVEDKAKAKELPYTSLAEFVAERYRTDLNTLGKLNPGLNLAKLKTGDSVIVPSVKPFFIESWPESNLSKAALPDASVRILHAERILEVVNADGTLAAAFPITVGTKPEHLRSGVWSVRSLTPNPHFLWDDVMLKEGRSGPTKHLLPPGPNSPVGILWVEIEPLSGPEAHIGIHGTADPARIGRNHSSGCIRLANWDVVRLARLIGKGTRITWGMPESAAPTLAAR